MQYIKSLFGSSEYEQIPQNDCLTRNEYNHPHVSHSNPNQPYQTTSNSLYTNQSRDVESNTHSQYLNSPPSSNQPTSKTQYNSQSNFSPHDDCPPFIPSPEATPNCWSDCDHALTLSKKERVIGFLVLFCLGWFLSVSTLSSYQNIFIQPKTFGIWYTLGNILSLCSNFFLYGPMNHCRALFSTTHRFPTFIYLLGIGATIFTLTRTPINIRMVIIAVVFQLCGSIIFTLSFLLSGVCGKALFWFFSDKYSVNAVNSGS